MNKSFDLTFFAIILAIGSVSLLTLYSLAKTLFFQQAFFWVLGLAILFIVSKIDYQNWKKVSVPFYVASVVALALLFVLGEPVRGSIRWIELGILRIQPSEIAKVASLLLVASFFVKNSPKNFKNLFFSLVVVTVPFVLVILQPDLGNSLSYLAIWLGLVFASGVKLKHLAVFLFLSILGSIFLYELLAPYQKQRILSFISPGQDPLGTGYHLIQSKISIGSGEFLGKGLGSGSQSQLNFLPEAASDFIFASISEQLGFLGSSFLIILFFLLFIKLLQLLNREDRFSQLLVVGSFSYLLLQFSVNIGMNMALLPVTGITLPLVSYGGSSLISTLFLFGILFSIKKGNLDG